jgi:hypothetical protein
MLMFYGKLIYAKLNFFRTINVLIACFLFTAVLLLAETTFGDNVYLDDNVNQVDGSAPCYIDEFLQNLVSEHGEQLLSGEGRLLLPYFIYAQQYILMYNSKMLTVNECLERLKINEQERSDLKFFLMFREYYLFALEIQRAFMKHAQLVYIIKYGSLDVPPIKHTDIPVYEEQASKGNLDAIRELIRYYQFPDETSYNPEQTEARFWLFKAIELGDISAMLEVGYDRPYSVRSELIYGNTTIAIDAVCEGIDQTGKTPYPACFLYNVLIGANPNQIGHLILDVNHLSRLSVRPQKLSIMQVENSVFVELISYSDAKREHIRKDYFDLDGNFLGSDQDSATTDYFWNYHVNSPNILPYNIQFDTNLVEAELVLEVDVRTMPYVESFLFWETEFPILKYLKALNYILQPSLNCPPYLQGKIPLDGKQIVAYYNQQMHFYDRMNLYFPLDPYIERRLNTRELSTLSSIETGYHTQELRNDPCDNFIPARSDVLPLKIYPALKCNNEAAFRAYEALEHRPTYVIELGSELESIRMLQVCRYNSTFTDEFIDSSNPDKVLDPSSYPSPCFVVQLRVETDSGYKYHYVVNVLPNIHIRRSTVFARKAEFFDFKEYFLLVNEVTADNYLNLSSSDYYRADIFDNNYNYIGSSNPVLSRIMVPEPKSLPENFNRQFLEWLRDGHLFQNTNFNDDGYFSYVYPECGDLIVLQRRSIANNQRGTIR